MMFQYYQQNSNWNDCVLQILSQQTSAQTLFRVSWCAMNFWLINSYVVKSSTNTNGDVNVTIQFFLYFSSIFLYVCEDAEGVMHQNSCADRLQIELHLVRRGWSVAMN